MIDNTFQLFIPTYGRAGKMLTHNAFPEAIVVCPESQLRDYQKFYPGLKYMPCPDSVEGNMAKKRNWILNNAEKDWIIMIDDDVKSFQYIEGGKQKELKGDHLKEVFHNGFVMCEEVGTVLWGVNLQTDPKFYREYSPFSFLSPVLGPFSAHIRSNIRYDERLPYKEDYDFSLQVLQRYHKILRVNKYSYMAGHLNNEGGYVSMRRMDVERSQNELLQKKWGKKIVKFDMSKSVNPKLKVPLKGI